MEKQVNLSIDMDGVLAKFNENLQAEELMKFSSFQEFQKKENPK